MVLAAGLGTRMRPLTETTAKPLLRLHGRTLLDHALDRLAEAGVTHAVVNAHWQAEQVAARLDARAREGVGPRTTLMVEETLLDTGGAVVRALPLLGDAPFFVVNGDAFWVDGPRPALLRMAGSFDAEAQDGLLLLHRSFQVRAETGFGDFALDPWGTLARRGERQVVPYVFAGVQLAAPRLFADAPQGAFSTNVLWDRAIAARRLRGLVHDGLWFHLSTPPDLDDAEYLLSVGATGETR
jgi:MurNAc alpha-1-phosphate uridylyltransferase